MLCTIIAWVVAFPVLGPGVTAWVAHWSASLHDQVQSCVAAAAFISHALLCSGQIVNAVDMLPGRGQGTVCSD